MARTGRWTLLALLLTSPLAAQQAPAAVAESVAARFTRGDFAGVTTFLAPRLAQYLSAASLRVQWEDALAEYGPFQGSGPADRQQSMGNTVTRIPLRFETGSNDLLVIDSSGAVIAFFLNPHEHGWHLPRYADTTVFREIAVRVGPDSTLPGLLTIPRGRGPFPVVVLVHGSGPSDRNEEMYPNRPFQDLAWGLSTRGIAVLRYDKRTRVAPYTFVDRPFTVEQEVLLDALDAVARMRRRPDIDPARVVVLGHSLGGILAPRIAQRDGALAGIVIAEGAIREGMLQVAMTQLTYLRSLSGADTTMLDAQLRLARDATERAGRLTLADSLSTTPILGVPASYFVDLSRYDVAATVRAISAPVLVLQGGRDYQVRPEDMRAWRAAVGDRPGLQVMEFPTLNHLMISGSGTPGPEEYAHRGHVALEVIDAVARWVSGLTPRPRPRP